MPKGIQQRTAECAKWMTGVQHLKEAGVPRDWIIKILERICGYMKDVEPIFIGPAWIRPKVSLVRNRKTKRTREEAVELDVQQSCFMENIRKRAKRTRDFDDTIIRTRRPNGGEYEEMSSPLQDVRDRRQAGNLKGRQRH